jgi:hypothetical protein
METGRFFQWDLLGSLDECNVSRVWPRSQYPDAADYEEVGL